MLPDSPPKNTAQYTHFIKLRIYIVNIYVFFMPLFVALEIFIFIFVYMYVYFYFAGPVIVSCTSMSKGGKSRSLLSFSIWPASAVSLCRFDVASITKFNNWVNGTNTLFIFPFCCCRFFYDFVVILLNKSPCHVSAGKTTPTWREKSRAGDQEVLPGMCVAQVPSKKHLSCSNFPCFFLNMTTNIKFHVLSGATEKVTE